MSEDMPMTKPPGVDLPGGPGGEEPEDLDWLVAAHRDIRRSSSAVALAMTSLIARSQRITEMREAGMSLAEIIPHLSVGARREVEDAIDEFRVAMANLRAGLAREMVDSEGMSYEEGALVMDITVEDFRQLYRQGQAML